MKIKHKNKSKEIVQYKSLKKILTPQDIKDADLFDDALNKEIQEIEKILLERNMVTPKNRKSNMLAVWYLIGTRINVFLTKYEVSPEEEKLFWDHLYGRSSVINKTIPLNNVSEARNDFKTASILANYPITKLKKIGSWSLCREIITYKEFKDKRVLNWVIEKLEQLSPKTRNDARPFLKATSARLKKIETNILSDKELMEKLEEIQIS